MSVTYPEIKARKSPTLAVAIAGAALAIAAGVGVWQASGSPSEVGRGPAATSAKPALDYNVRNDRMLVLYLVDSQEQEDMVRANEAQAAQERASSGIPEPDYVFLVMKSTTPQELEGVREILDAWSTSSGGVFLSDLRGE
jgi:hypothetical protein